MLSIAVNGNPDGGILSMDSCSRCGSVKPREGDRDDDFTALERVELLLDSGLPRLPRARSGSIRTVSSISDGSMIGCSSSCVVVIDDGKRFDDLETARDREPLEAGDCGLADMAVSGVQRNATVRAAGDLGGSR